MKGLIALFLGVLVVLGSSGLFRIANAGNDNYTSYSLLTYLGDLNHDGIVNATDALILQQNFGTHNAVADTNGDGIVNMHDALVIARNYGKNFTDLFNIPVVILPLPLVQIG